MFREEMKKLFVKQFGFVVIAFLFVGEVIFTNILYPRSTFANDFSDQLFVEYMTEFSGELTSDKEQKILIEQERIINARNAESALETQLYNGEFVNRNEFRAEYNKLHNTTLRAEAFNEVLEKYYYVLGNRENRFIAFGKYEGLGQDYPDVLMLVAIIIITATTFLNEENTNVSTLIRTSENGRRKVLKMKILALLIFICAGQFLRALCELSVMTLRGNIDELSFPVQSIPFFQNCPYSLTIAQCFLVISTLRLLGYFFVSSLVMLLAVKVKKPLFTVFIPCSICLLQQFVFEPAELAYCIPTGLLRASGYMRGDFSGNIETAEDFSEVPVEMLIVVLAFTIMFIALSIIVANKYYRCVKRSFKCNSIAISVAIVIICCTFSGCAPSDEKSVIYNLCDNFFFAQNDDYYFISNQDGITRIEKSGGDEFQIIRDPFLSNAGLYGMAICGNDLYCLDAFGSKKVSVISLETLSESTFVSDRLSEYPVYSAFTNGESLFFSTFDDNGIYEVQNNKIRKIISDKIYNNQLCFDGKKIFYINSMLELICYDTRSNEQSLLSEDFARAVYYDGKRIVYSTDKGIFSLDNNVFSIERLSEITATRICSDGTEIIFLNDGKLYCLGNEVVEIFDNEPLYFALISKSRKVVLRQYDHKNSENVDLFIVLPEIV